MDISNVIADKQEEWVEYREGVSFLLAYSESKEPQNYRDKGISKLRRKARNAVDIPQSKLNAFTLDVMVECIVKDWKGWTANGTEFAYSKENCRTLLSQSPVIRDFVANESQDIENFGGNLSGEAEEGETAKSAMKSAPPVAT